MKATNNQYMRCVCCKNRDLNNVRVCLCPVDDVVDKSDDNEDTDTDTENDTENEDTEKDQRTVVIPRTYIHTHILQC